MASSSSPSSSSLPRNWKHHVFPSFMGADVGKNFLSHIIKEFRSKGINVLIDNDIERNTSISSELIEAIKASRIAIVVLSKNYASSTWCLDELVEIMKCRGKLGQTVIPVFYEVDPTHVKKQTGYFGKVFMKTCKGKTKDKIQRWKHALKEVANILGYDSTYWDSEARMIEDIATKVSNKLKLLAPSSDFDSLVGMESLLTRIKPLLRLDSDEVRKIGIWGPLGIGKTSIAKSIFNRYSQDFELSVFMDNIKRKNAVPACSDDYSVRLYLQKKLLSKLTNETSINISHSGVVKDRLKDQKVLVVLDDVDPLVQLEAMAKETCWFGPGSLIIITTQDEKVLKQNKINLIHQVDLPSDGEALQMFCMYAFGQEPPEDGFRNLARKVVSLVGKLPLGLRVMGSYFRGMSEQDWKEALPRLKTHLDRDRDIMNILKFSYNALHDEDKRLFLHIACFFADEEVDIVEGCLADCFSNVTQGLRVLAEKSLISMEFKTIEMGELLIQLGRKIVREQSFREPGKRQFLHDPVDIGEVLNDDKSDNNTVIGICLDYDEDITCTRERAFERLSNLQFLRINSNGIDPRSIKYISKKLRVLQWMAFDMPCFPSSFSPKFLVKLDLSDSHLEKLWEDNKPLGNLKWMDLSDSKNLKELPDLSTATNLYKLDLCRCSSLVELPCSIGNAINLKELNLALCSSLVELPSSMRNLGRLFILSLLGCSKLEVNLANINLESLYELDLSDCSLLRSYTESSTDIQKLDPWIGSTSRLQKLVLKGMKKLVSLPPLPDSILELDVENCESLERLDCSFRNPVSCLNFSYCFKLNQEARDLIIQTSTNEYAVLPGGEVPQCFTYRSYGSSVTVKLNQMPLATSTKFKACIIFALVDKQNFEAKWRNVCCSITSGGNAITSLIRKFEEFYEGHLYTFDVEVETEEVTSTDLVFEFDVSGTLKEAPIWEIKECGILQLLQVPLLSFKDVDSDYESFEDDDGEDKKLAHHDTSSLCDVELTERKETFLQKGLSQVRPKLTITNEDVKENVITSERASKKTSSNGLLHKVCIYCEDTLQYSFASHLSVDFHRKGIDASVNCNETMDMIEGASAFVVVLSKNYLSSPSCLDKLVRVLQCRIKHVQLVIPVFYGISPSDVAVQEQESDDRIRDWTSALQELRDLPGIHSREESSDCELVEEIVKEVYEKLFPTQQLGVNSRLVEIKQLLCKQPWGIRRIGIWGMPGIGKTTLAKAFFDQVSGGYEASCFIKHFDKAFHEKGLYSLWDKHFGKILKDIPSVCSSITRPSLPGEIKHKKRTLVVLDDVQNHLVAESFLGGFHWFGPGSLIIITSRDKRVLRLCQINHVYEVKSLNENEALQLFSHCAFGEDIKEKNLLELSMEVIDYANGNPLALSFYGEELKGKDLSEMETTLLNFKIRTPKLIHDLLKSSYETLNDNEKEIFLDIACFFKGEDVDHVMQLLEGCGLFPHVEIDVLVEKCLVTLSENRVEMHRIIQDFGRGINDEETTWSKSGRRWDPSFVFFVTRLSDPSAIRYLLEENEHPKETLVTEDIKAISLDTTNLRFDVNPTAFVNMLNLRFLKIYSRKDGDKYGLFLRKGLDSLPCELRLLHWENYPLQSLPQDFDPRRLVELIMPYSQLQKLWRGTKNLEVLKMIMLCHSHKLTEIEDICKAQNIEVIDLEGCTKLQSFPATGHLQHLRVVNLSGCKEIKSFTEFSPNIAELNLQGTAITELPRSIGNATSLKKLCLRGCLNLVKLPSSLGNAISLQELNLEFCSSLLELPSSFGNATNIKKLYLTGCSSLDELPYSIRNSTSLISIDLNDDNSLPIVTVSDNSGSKCVEVRRANRGKFFVLEGEQKNEHYVSLMFHFVNENEHPMSVYTPFYLNDDIAYEVSCELIERLDLTDIHVTFIAELIDIVLVNLIPAWNTEVAVNYLTHSQLNQNLRSHQNEAKTQQREEESAAIRDYALVSYSWTSDSSRKDEKGKRVDEIEEKEESSGEEENEQVGLEEEERLNQEQEEIESKYLEEMKEIERKRKAIMETKKKLSQIKRQQVE